jgi:glycosyltransferase involved in cell wall biosynthesis
MLSCTFRLLFLRRHDVVIALTSPPLISFLGALFSRLRGSQFCYWVMDFNPDEAIAAGWLRSGSLAAKILERLSRFSLHQASRVFALDRFMRDRIAAKGIDPEKICIIPPWSHDDDVHFDSTGRDRFRAQHGLKEKFVVMYSGNHSPCHPLDTLLKAADLLRNDPHIHFCFVGGGSEWNKLPSAPNILRLPYQPLAELSASLSVADLHVVVMGDPFVGLVHPCKIYNILSVGTPILYIGPQPSHVSEILAHLPSHWPSATFRHGDAEGTARLISTLSHASRLAGNPGSTAPRPSIHNFRKQPHLSSLITELEAIRSTD